MPQVEAVENHFPQASSCDFALPVSGRLQGGREAVSACCPQRRMCARVRAARRLLVFDSTDPIAIDSAVHHH
jgi:hypothetical protein